MIVEYSKEQKEFLTLLDSDTRELIEAGATTVKEVASELVEKDKAKKKSKKDADEKLKKHLKEKHGEEMWDMYYAEATAPSEEELHELYSLTDEEHAQMHQEALNREKLLSLSWKIVKEGTTKKETEQIKTVESYSELPEETETDEEFIYLRKEFMDFYDAKQDDNKTLATKEEKLAYICIRNVVMKADTYTYTSLFFLLERVGLDGKDNKMIAKLKIGLERLDKRFKGLIEEEYKGQYILKNSMIDMIDHDEGNFIMLPVEDLKKISKINIPDVRTKIGIICFYASLIGSINKQKGNAKRNIGTLSIEYLASISMIDKNSACKYKEILRENGIITVCKNVVVLCDDGSYKKTTEAYARKKHEKLCIQYAMRNNQKFIESKGE